MRHSHRLEGPAFRLRPVEEADSGLIVELRNDPAATPYLHQSAADVPAQMAWLERYFDRDDDYYFVVERREDSAAEGLVGLYDVDSSGRSAEWGRWVLRPRSVAAVESAWLIYRLAFDHLHLHEVYCRTVVENAHVVSFHDSCGLTRRCVIRQHANLGGVLHDVVEHAISATEWPALSARLGGLAASVARRRRG